METSSAEGGQTPFTTVHERTFSPKARLLAGVEAEFSSSKVALPEITLQEPEPTRGISAFKLSAVPHKLESTPALAAVGGSSL